MCTSAVRCASVACAHKQIGSVRPVPPDSHGHPCTYPYPPIDRPPRALNPFGRPLRAHKPFDRLLRALEPLYRLLRSTDRLTDRPLLEAGVAQHSELERSGQGAPGGLPGKGKACDTRQATLAGRARGGEHQQRRRQATQA